MSAAALVTPTTSQLSALNSIQTLITNSINWRVVSTGTTTSGKKYLEAAPVVGSAYKNMRVLFLEMSTNNNGKTFVDNSTTLVNKLCYMVCPDGGASYCTLTPSRLESASAPYFPVYVGTKYSPAADYWSTIDSPYTALWMYECNGAMWIANRNSATSHSLHAIGQVFNHPRVDWCDWDEVGNELGLMGMYSVRGLASTGMGGSTVLFSTSTSNRGLLFATRTSATATATWKNVGGGQTPGASWIVQSPAYEGTLGTALFMPVAAGGNTSVGGVVMRGFYLIASFQTRTTIKDSTGTTTLGFTFYPDDAASGYAAAWMSTP
jgi:hypothetical protein